MARELPESMQTGLRDAEALLRAGDRTGAFERYLALAQHYVETGQRLEATAIGFRALGVDPGSFTSARVAAFLRRLGGAAVPLCRRSIREHLGAERLEAAMAMFEVLLWLDPNDVAARHELADLYARSGRRGDATAMLESTCRRLIDTGRDRDLIATVRALLRLDPDNVAALRKLTHACLRLGRAPVALAAATRLVAMSPDGEALELLARVYVELDRPGEALDALRRMTEIAAAQADFALVRALAWRVEPDFHRGVAHLRARLRAQTTKASTRGSTDPFAPVPDAPELLEPPPADDPG